MRSRRTARLQLDAMFCRLLAGIGDMLKRLAWSVGLVPMSVACTHVQPLSNAYSAFAADVGDRCSIEARHQDGSCDLYDVTLIELLAVPEKFHGKRVRVAGFMTLAFEDNSLCAGDLPGAGCLWLDIEGVKDPGFRKGWAEIEGRFDGEGRGHIGCCSGTIDGITSVARLHR